MRCALSVKRCALSVVRCALLARTFINELVERVFLDSEKFFEEMGETNRSQCKDAGKELDTDFWGGPTMATRIGEFVGHAKQSVEAVRGTFPALDASMVKAGVPPLSKASKTKLDFGSEMCNLMLAILDLSDFATDGLRPEGDRVPLCEEKVLRFCCVCRLTLWCRVDCCQSLHTCKVGTVSKSLSAFKQHGEDLSWTDDPEHILVALTFWVEGYSRPLVAPLMQRFRDYNFSHRRLWASFFKFDACLTLPLV